MWMRLTRYFAVKTRTEKWVYLVAALVALVLAFQFYVPTFSYWAYQKAGGHVVLAGRYSIRMAACWYPVYLSESSSSTYVLFAKINPWFPSRSNVPALDMSYRSQGSSINLGENAKVTKEKFGWGEAYFLDGLKTAILENGELRINFTNRADLNDILEIKKE
jgi:hypothetical protein